MPYTVFVGHSGDDYDLVEAIQDAARPKGIRVYTYEQDLQPGADLSAKLQRRIRSADVLVVLLTEDGAFNPTVNQEVGIAKEAGTTIVPVIDEKAVSISELPFLQGIEYLPFNRSNPVETVRQLSGHLSRLADDKQKRQQRALLLVGAAFLLWANSE